MSDLSTVITLCKNETINKSFKNANSLKVKVSHNIRSKDQKENRVGRVSKRDGRKSKRKGKAHNEEMKMARDTSC